MRYLLDTNICIYLIKQQPPQLLVKLKSALPLGVGLSSITLSELEYGVQKSAHIERNSLNLLRFLTVFEIVPFDESAARWYGILRANLEKTAHLSGAWICLSVLMHKRLERHSSPITVVNSSALRGCRSKIGRKGRLHQRQMCKQPRILLFVWYIELRVFHKITLQLFYRQKPHITYLCRINSYCIHIYR